MLLKVIKSHSIISITIQKCKIGKVMRMLQGNSGEDDRPAAVSASWEEGVWESLRFFKKGKKFLQRAAATARWRSLATDEACAWMPALPCPWAARL